MILNDVEFQVDLPEKFGGQYVHVICTAVPGTPDTMCQPSTNPHIEDLLVTDNQGNEIQMSKELTNYITDMALEEAHEQDMMGDVS
jgi:hypothetical protein